MDARNAKQFVRELIEAEFSSGFPFVRRIPSTDTWKTLVYLETLNSEERSILFDVLAERGSGWFQDNLDMDQYVKRQKELVHHPAYVHYLCQQTSVFKYADPSFLRQLLDIHRQSSTSRFTPDFSPVPLSVAENAEPPTTASAGEIRKEVKRAFAERYHIKPTNLGSGIWNYPGEYNGRPFTLTLNWGRIFNLRYAVSPCHFPAHKQFHGVGALTWEGMLGLGIGHWNFVCQHNLVRSVALWGEIIEKILMLAEQTGRPGNVSAGSPAKRLYG